MPDLVNVTYAQTGKSLSVNRFGMREMQERVYEQRKAQYLLTKAPPASGKSRALMFLGLDKLYEQGLRKVIVAVPERSIGGSFDQTDLTSHGFFADWTFNPDYNLCTPGSESSKVKAFIKFLNDPNEAILICTHATLRFAFDSVETSVFNRILLAIDEFHHVSADGDNKLGEVLRSIMDNTDAHIAAMTGSYFRGDGVPVISPAVEARFTKVTYNYYEQLNGYTHLKTLGIGYHFYQGKYLTAIHEILDTNKKTILHIPNVNAGESTKDKYQEVDAVIDIIGEFVRQDPAIYTAGDVLEHDPLGLLGEDKTEEIFLFRHVPQTVSQPDHVAYRKKCDEFEKFDPLFRQCHLDLKSGKKTTIPYRSERQIAPETIFILQGMLVYVGAQGQWETKKGGKKDARLYCVFENGTESHMLLRSLATSLWKDEGRRQVVDAD